MTGAETRRPGAARVSAAAHADGLRQHGTLSTKTSGPCAPECVACGAAVGRLATRAAGAATPGWLTGSIDQMSRSLMQLAAASPGPGALWRKN